MVKRVDVGSCLQEKLGTCNRFLVKWGGQRYVQWRHSHAVLGADIGPRSQQLRHDQRTASRTNAYSAVERSLAVRGPITHIRTEF